MKYFVFLQLFLVCALSSFAAPVDEVVKISIEQQYDQVRPGGKSALAVHFELDEDWHFYASAKSAPGGMNLKVVPAAEKLITFAEPVLPGSHQYFDKSSNKTLEVFSDKFTVFVPFTVSETDESVEVVVSFNIDGAVCSGLQCRLPDFDGLTAKVKINPQAVMSGSKFVLPEIKGPGPGLYSILFALGLAILAGLSLNIMPCVWPVLPLIVMRIIEQARQSRGRSIVMGLAFCLGILLFFGCLAGANIILQLFYGTALQWGDQFRNPAFVGGMAILLVVLALFMFGLFAITVPSSIASKSGSGKGYTGAVGMGFLAAILSTPCSFGILAAAFAWAQSQKLVLGTVAIMSIGVGMAIPYAILTSIPGLLKKMPKAGQWMEIFKQAVGFILLFIAIWLIAALPQQYRVSMLYFALAVSFCIWMWGGWVSYNTKLSRKVIIRIIAVLIAIAAAMASFSKGSSIDWQKYDTDVIDSAIKEDRPVLIKFMADWCLSCKVVEKTVYSNKDVARLIKEKNVLAIKADTTTRQMPATKALKDIYNEPGVPVSMLFLPGEKEPVRWHNDFFADELKELLEELPAQ